MTGILRSGISRVTQVERIYWLDGQIRANSYPNAQRLADQFDVTTRTAYDDHRHLRDRLGAPVHADRNRRGWFYSDPTYVLPFLALSEPEAGALRRTMLAAEEYLGVRDAAVIRRLIEMLPPGSDGRKRIESFSGAMHLAPEIVVDSELMEACRLAVRTRRKLWIRYHGAHIDRVSERVIHPYRVHSDRGETYLIGWCEAAGAVRQFFLPRVKLWRLLEPDAAFTQDPGFDIDAFLGRGLGAMHGEPIMNVSVRFSPYQARWIRERRYHPTQGIEELTDGGLILTMQVAGRDEVRRWLLAYGAEAEVLEPADLRAEVAAEAKKLSNIYEPGIN
jgi:predicted DNA-binding transcriptional regulator YafY